MCILLLLASAVVDTAWHYDSSPVNTGHVVLLIVPWFFHDEKRPLVLMSPSGEFEDRKGNGVGEIHLSDFMREREPGVPALVFIDTEGDIGLAGLCLGIWRIRCAMDLARLPPLRSTHPINAIVIIRVKAVCQ